MFNLNINVVATNEEMKQRLQKDGFASLRATDGSAAYDLHGWVGSYTQYMIDPGETVMIDTGLSIHIGSSSFCALVLPRSGLASKQGLAPINSPGLIDSDYQGPLKVALHNFSDSVQTIEMGSRIAQLLFIPVVNVNAALVERHMDATERGAGGFGSTGTS